LHLKNPANYCFDSARKLVRRVEKNDYGTGMQPYSLSFLQFLFTSKNLKYLTSNKKAENE